MKKGQFSLGYANLVIVSPPDLPGMKATCALLVLKFPVVLAVHVKASVEERVVSLPAPSARAPDLVCSSARGAPSGAL